MSIHAAEQQALVDSVRALLDKRADSAAVRAADGFDQSLWQVLTEQIGVAALMVPEEHGGAGASLVEAALVLEELGRSLAPVPMLGSVIAAAATDDPAVLERIATGEVAAVAFDADHVLYGAEAGVLLTADGTPLDARATRLPTLDPTLRLASLDAAVPCTPPSDALLVSVSALAVGCMQRGLDMTVSYAKQRHQFGRPIGSFQALKHRMADMLVLVEMSRSATRAAAAGELDPRTAAAYTLPAALTVAGETIQLHGGIAITWEHDAHLVLKRAHALNQLCRVGAGLTR